MKYIVIAFLAFVTLVAHANDRSIEEYVGSTESLTQLRITVFIDSMEEEWFIELGKRPIESCHLVEARTGHVLVKETKRSFDIHYQIFDSSLVIETSPHCDAGSSLSISVTKSKYLGLVHTRYGPTIRLRGGIYGEH